MNVTSYRNYDDLIAKLLIPFAVVWWSIWYPGAEPGGGGYLVQRMLAAKNENHAVGATLFFNAAHYALRPWPWLLVALASLVVYPDLDAIHGALNGALPDAQIRDDVAYSLMLTKLPAGWLGLMLASLAAAYMSTISTHLNWGASYLVNDVWRRFYRPQASPRELVWLGRLFTVVLMILAGLLALRLQSALDTFKIMLSIGAGTGLLFMLRWFWWRINAAAEITAMIASFVFAIYFQFYHSKWFPQMQLAEWEPMVWSVAMTTACWVAACFLGPRTGEDTLRKFVERINPGGPGWNAVFRRAESEGVKLRPVCKAQSIALGVVAAVFSCLAVYATLIATGEFIYQRSGRGVVVGIFGGACALIVLAIWKKINRTSKVKL